MLKTADKQVSTSVEADPRVPLRRPGDRRDETITVGFGLLGLYAMDARGSRLFVGLRFPGEKITASTLGGLGIWPLVKSELTITAPTPPLALSQCARDLAIAHEWLAQQRVGKAERVAHLLCEMAVRGNSGTQRMPFPITQEQLADLTGQTNVNVNRVLAELTTLGLIARERPSEITFPDWEALCRFGGFNPDYLEAST